MRIELRYKVSRAAEVIEGISEALLHHTTAAEQAAVTLEVTAV